MLKRACFDWLDIGFTTIQTLPGDKNLREILEFAIKKPSNRLTTHSPVATAHSPSGEFAVDPNSANRPQASAFGRCAEATDRCPPPDTRRRSERKSPSYALSLEVLDMFRFTEEQTLALKRLCLKHDVRRLELFGSAATDEYVPGESNLDFIVEFGRSKEISRADQYFGQWEDLRALFDCEVDLVVFRAMRNPYFIEAANRTRKTVYASEESQDVHWGLSDSEICE
jgi:predicted nucleotidyltransferase